MTYIMNYCKYFRKCNNNIDYILRQNVLAFQPQQSNGLEQGPFIWDKTVQCFRWISKFIRKNQIWLRKIYLTKLMLRRGLCVHVEYVLLTQLVLGFNFCILICIFRFSYQNMPVVKYSLIIHVSLKVYSLSCSGFWGSSL